MYNINALRKIAGVFDRDAGVGTARENSIRKIRPSSLDLDPYHVVGNSASYFGRLIGNASSESDKDRVANHSPNNQLIIGAINGDPLSGVDYSHIANPVDPESNLTQKWIDAARKSMAEEGANEILPQDKGRRTPAWKRVFDNLIHAGKENQSEFRSSGKVHKRDAFEFDRHGLGPQLRNLTPEQKQRLLQLQNMQVRSFVSPNERQLFGA